MADDLEDLKARVAAARDRLTSDVAFAQKVELRLNDLARIVDGSLARQSADLEAAQSRIAALDADLVRALARAEQAAGDAARADRLTKENGELRSMVMTLLEVIEGRQKSSLATVMQKLEENMAALIAPEAPPVTVPKPDEVSIPDDVPAPEEVPMPGIEPEAEPTPETEPQRQPEPVPDVVMDDDLGPEPASDLELEPDQESELDATAKDQSAPSEAVPMEDLSEIALYDASEEVVEPGRI